MKKLAALLAAIAFPACAQFDGLGMEAMFSAMPLAAVDGTWTPSNTISAAWYSGSQFISATGTITSTWSDSSGNSKNATQTLTARPYAYPISTKTGYLNFSKTLLQHMELPSGVVPPQNHTVYLASARSSSATARVIIGRAYNFGAFYVSYTTNHFLRYVVDDVTLNSPAAMPVSQFTIACLQYDSTNLTMWIDGSLSTNIACSKGAIDYNVNDAPCIGAFENTGGAVASTLDAGVGEIIIKHSVDGTSDRQIAEGYLAWKFDIQSSLPSGHPYKTVRP